MKRYFFFVLCWMWVPVQAHAQLTKIMGTVTDGSTREPVPFVNIVIPGTTAGMLTGFDGSYSLEFKMKGDSIRAFLLGYKGVTKKIQPNQFQVIDFELMPQNLNLPELIITYHGNPAEALIDKVIRNKDKNSLQSFQSYQYEAYTKIQLDANNISDRLRNRKMFRQFEFVWGYLDTSTLNGKSYLPVLITETLSDIYFRK